MLKRVLFCAALFIPYMPVSLAEPTPTLSFPTPGQAAMPTITPTAPVLAAKGYVLMDATSGKILAAQNAEQRMPPASLTKMMTSYLVSEAIRQGHIKMDDRVRISEKAWRMGGSKMFVKVGDSVPVQELMQGIIVDSGNDACVAMAEHVAGSEDAFAGLMNQQAAILGMKATQFTDSTGLPHPQHYTTPYDMAILGRALVLNFPEDYKWYSQKWFTYNGIKQPNRNRLLWRDPTVDGIKTGHTDEAGFCLVSSAQRNNTRLIAVVMGAPTDNARAEDSHRLLTYGFRFFETHQLYTANTELQKIRVWQGKQREISVGVLKPVYVTIMPGQYAKVQTKLVLNTPVKAPVSKGQVLGSVQLTLNGEEIGSEPIVALQEDPKGGFFTRITDAISLSIKGFFNKSV